jgi:Flp pilus assembly pilin Flp
MGILKRFWKNEQGVEVVEYAIILGIIVVVSLSAIILIGSWVQGQFEYMVTTVGAP